MYNNNKKNKLSRLKYYIRKQMIYFDMHYIRHNTKYWWNKDIYIKQIIYFDMHYIKQSIYFDRHHIKQMIYFDMHYIKQMIYFGLYMHYIKLILHNYEDNNEQASLYCTINWTTLIFIVTVYNQHQNMDLILYLKEYKS